MLETIRKEVHEGTLCRALLDRRLLVGTQLRVEDQESRYVLKHGVPQGDSLGPIMFVGVSPLVPTA